ncbi:MAG: alpha/beta hydrolase, partial [Clostridia bacterium]|nr:alpha/beta hydrolase [Clostridia bacterium]
MKITSKELRNKWLNFYEQRGHGFSQGKGKEPDVVHVDSYREYVEDLKAFMDHVVNPQTEGLKHILYAHSMGGAVSALFLEQY